MCVYALEAAPHRHVYIRASGPLLPLGAAAAAAKELGEDVLGVHPAAAPPERVKAAAAIGLVPAERGWVRTAGGWATACG